MLQHQLIHPKINEILARAGHHSSILIADGNYPASTKRGPHAKIVSLNLTPGVVNCSQVFEAILSAVPVDKINVMGIDNGDSYALDGDPPIWVKYRKILAGKNLDLDLEPIPKWDFYHTVMSDDHVLTIQTAEQELWANILLSIGCRI